MGKDYNKREQPTKRQVDDEGKTNPREVAWRAALGFWEPIMSSTDGRSEEMNNLA